MVGRVPRVPPAARGVCDRAAPAFRRHVGMYTVRIKASAAGSNLVALRRVGACRQGFVIIQKLNRFKAMKRTTSDPSPCHREFRIGETGIAAGPLSPLGAGRRKAASSRASRRFPVCRRYPTGCVFPHPQRPSPARERRNWVVPRTFRPNRGNRCGLVWVKGFLFFSKNTEGGSIKVPHPAIATDDRKEKVTEQKEYTGSEILLRCLIREGVDTLFGYPGGAVLPIYDSLYHKGIRHILARHEQGAIHMAEGYARITGKPGVVIATSGPGATNLVTGIANAQMDSIPLVCITGNVPQNLIGTDAFQEADITGITMPITKHNYFVTDVRDLARVVKEAFVIASTGRPGPVLIDIPKDVSNAKTSLESPDEVFIRGYQPTTDPHPLQV